MQLAQQQWKAAGIQVTLNSYDEATLVVDALEGKDQAFWFGWGANVPYGLFHHNYLAPAANPTNWTRLDNPTVISDIQTLAGCTTQQCTLQATDSIDQVFDQQVPVIFLMSTVEGWLHRHLQGGSATLAPANSSGLDPELMWQYLWQK